MKGVKAQALNEGRDIVITLEANSERSLRGLESKLINKIQYAVEKHMQPQPEVAEDRAILGFLKS
jgi:hypothetical protein